MMQSYTLAGQKHIRSEKVIPISKRTNRGVLLVDEGKKSAHELTCKVSFAENGPPASEIVTASFKQFVLSQESGVLPDED